ncbi:MAG: hypothetical protein IT285_04040 [Bdellovibrionales bacterium]|nr:hypothetical protein [Bdellovibrionales bacterium]
MTPSAPAAGASAVSSEAARPIPPAPICPAESAHLEIPIQAGFIKPAVDFVLSYAAQLGLTEERRRSLRFAVGDAMAVVLERNVESPGVGGSVAIQVFRGEKGLGIRILNRGVPVFEDEAAARLERLRLQGASGPKVDGIVIENLGRDGQSLTLEVKLGIPQGEVLKTGTRPVVQVAGKELVIRALRPEEAPALSRLFHSVYGYDYIGDYVYYPERLRAMLEDGSLTSTVAEMAGGRLIGHVGLVRRASSPAVYEPCMGVVDPGVKSSGTFKRLFEVTMKRVAQTPMQYAFSDCVTNIDFSQRLVARYSGVDTALFVGSQSKETQAKLVKLGLGRDPEDMDRYSILYSVIPRVEHPFGAEVVLPGNLGEMLGFLLPSLGLDWAPAPRFNPLPRSGSFSARSESAQRSIYFELPEPGHQAVTAILEDWAQALKTGCQYAAVDVPLDPPGLGQVHDLLAAQGFFVSGFLPWRHSARLCVRFQATGPTRVAWDKIKVFSEQGQRLRDVIRADCERNQLL